MKNLLTLCLVVACVAMFSSCKKDFTCTCTILGQEVVTDIIDVSKSTAEATCTTAETTARLTDPEANCVLD